MKKLTSLPLSIIIYLLLTLSLAANDKEVVVWSYYQFGPFQTDIDQGLSADLIKLFNDRSKGERRYKLLHLPRTRINLHLNSGVQGMVLFVNWSWMGDPQKTKYLWSLPIMSDQRDYISRMSGTLPVKIEFTSIESVSGYTLGGVLGRNYGPLEKAIKSGLIIRDDTRGEDQNLKKLLLGRIDFMTGASSTFRFLIKEMGIKDQIYFSKANIAQRTYTRHILVTRELSDEYERINELIKQLQHDKEWLAILSKYGL